MRLWRVAGIVLAVLAVMLFIASGFAEDEERTVLYVTANHLNGRAAPRKTGIKEALWDKGDSLHATGRWSDDHKWVQVHGGEIGLVWCCADYVTERTDAFQVTNESRRKIKIRSKPVDGKVIGYLKPGRSLTISRVVLGWGRCKSGWIDLEYVIEEELTDGQ